MADTGVRTVRSFCRVCQSVCGILVDVHDDPAGERVLRVRGDRDHPVSAGYTCPKGRALPQLHHHPDRLEHPSSGSTGRCATSAGRPVSTISPRGCGPSSTATARRRSASSSAPGSAWTPPGTGWPRPPDRHRHARQVQPADHRRHRQTAGRRPDGRVHGAVLPGRPRRRRLLDLRRQQPGRLARPRAGDAERHRDHPRDRPPRAGVGHRSTAHRDRPPGHRPPGSATRDRLRRAGLPGARVAGRRGRSRHHGTPGRRRRATGGGRGTLHLRAPRRSPTSTRPR